MCDPGEHGWLVPAGDVDELANAMLDCLEMSAERLAMMGKAAHARVFERHNIDIEVLRLAELFGSSGRGFVLIGQVPRSLKPEILIR